MTPILYILAFAVGFLLVQLAIHLAWKRRRAKTPVVSPTVESMGAHLKALYSSAALEEMAKQENPLFKLFEKQRTEIAEMAERKSQRLFADHTIPPVPLESSGIVFKPGKPLNPVPADEPKDGES